MSWVAVFLMGLACTGDRSTTDTTEVPTDTSPTESIETGDSGSVTDKMPGPTAEVRITNYLVHRSEDHWGVGGTTGLGEVDVHIDGKPVATLDYCDDADLTLLEGKRTIEVFDAESGEALSAGWVQVPLPPRSDGKTKLANVFGLRSPTLAIRNDRNNTKLDLQVRHEVNGTQHDVSAVSGPLAVGIDVPAGLISYDSFLNGSPVSSGTATLLSVNVMLCDSVAGEIDFSTNPNCAAINRIEDCDGELDFVPPSLVVP